MDGFPDSEISLEEHAVHEMYDAVGAADIWCLDPRAHPATFHIHVWNQRHSLVYLPRRLILHVLINVLMKCSYQSFYMTFSKMDLY